MASLNYIGSKKTMLPFLMHVIEPLLQENKRGRAFCDLFSGTGCVFGAVRDRAGVIVANDMELYAYVIACALLKCPYSHKLAVVIDQLNICCGVDAGPGPAPGLVAKHFASGGRMYFSFENACAIDGMRKGIAGLYERGAVSYHEFLFLLGSLITSASAVSNTCGTFRAHLKHMSGRAKKKFKLVSIHVGRGSAFAGAGAAAAAVYKKDATRVPVPDGAVAYLDPPYNSAHYGAYYSFLNYLCLYDSSIATCGTGTIPGYQKSAFGLAKECRAAFQKLIFKTCARAGYIVLSYSSAGIMGIRELLEMLEKRGQVTVYKVWYKAYCALKRNHKKNRNHVVEYIIVARCGVFGPTKRVWLKC